MDKNHIYIDKRIYFVYTNIKGISIVYTSEVEKMELKNLREDNVYTIQTNIRRWGNSQGIRLTKEILAQMNLQENDTVGINVYDGKMTVEKINKPKYLNLEERLEAFYKRPIDEIYVESTQEVDVGAPVGNEQW
jgi:antitoxin MazE